MSYIFELLSTIAKICKEAYIEVVNPLNTKYFNVDIYKRDIWMAK